MESSGIPQRLSPQTLFPFRLNMCTILASLNPKEPLLSSMSVHNFTQCRDTLEQLFTVMLVDLISEGMESALDDLPDDICWIMHRTSAKNGGWPIYELPRPTVGSHQAQYCQ